MDLPFIMAEELGQLEFNRGGEQFMYLTNYYNSLPLSTTIDLPTNSFHDMIPAEKPSTPEVSHKRKSSLRCLTARTISISPNKIPVIVNRCFLTKAIGNTVLKSPMQSFNSFLKSEFGISQVITPTKSRKPCCSCKKSRCIKLYCDCFAGNSRCEGCQCVNCNNTEEYTQKALIHTEQSKELPTENKSYPKVYFIEERN